MKISELFEMYDQKFKRERNILEAFEKSKMTNVSNELDFGFFPIGSGILNEEKSKIETAEISNCEIMVLGNDFGNIKYFAKCKKPEKKEKTSNSTIKNLETLKLKSETTFYTNLFLGLRKGKMVGLKKLDENYVKFCISFLKIQLKFINPKIVLCLGNEVKASISCFSKEFEVVSGKTFAELYSSENEIDFIVKFNERKFIFIPHPCYAHINWKKYNVKERIGKVLENNSL